ncbi:MAG TPA: CAP domain-containing protein [Pyrinomonadaceae bacterium]|nr:CAP domain-containing protein [Pyrinomonadaceae bacterium]
MTRSLRTSLLALFGLLFCCPAILGQEAESESVARLLTRFTPATTSVSSNASPTFEQASSIERRAFEQTNQVRAQNGLPSLEWDADICRMARSHSESMFRLNYFSHVTPDGLRLRDRARAAGVLSFRVLAENIAYNQGYEDPGAFAVERWMASPKHLANILSTEFRAMAIGTYVAPDGSVFLTQTFITR